MTGSSNKQVSPQLPHAVSPQWLELVEGAAEAEGRFSKQPHAWWAVQAKASRDQWLLTGLPTTRLESWKYTSLVILHGEARKVKSTSVSVRPPTEIASPAAKIRTLRLSELSDQHDAAVLKTARELLTVSAEKNSGVFFESMAKSLVEDPVLVIVPEGFKSDEPVELQWPSAPSGEWLFGVALVVVGARAEVVFVEKYGGGQGAITPVSLFSIGEGARVGHLRLQNGVSSVVLASSKSLVAAAATYETTQVSFGSELSREDLTVELRGSSAQTTTDGVFIGRGRQVLDHHTNLVHCVGNTTSGQVYKGILSDESRGIFNGRIAILKNASKSDSSQMNRNLLLSKKVEIDTKPQLEIDNDDVKAAHGAAIGRLDPEHVFYLKSRGIPESEAIEILSRGFAFEAVERISSLKLRELGVRSIDFGLRGLSWDSL